MVQFILKTIGVFFLLLPFAWYNAGGYEGIVDRLGEAAFDFAAIGVDTIMTYFVIYTFGMLIGQDIWQRVFTARSRRGRAVGAAPRHACTACCTRVAGAVIGMAAKVLLPALEARDDAFAEFVEMQLPPILAGLVLAAAVAAMMSTSSGALIATATVLQPGHRRPAAQARHRSGQRARPCPQQPALRGRLRHRDDRRSPACCRTWSQR